MISSAGGYSVEKIRETKAIYVTDGLLISMIKFSIINSNWRYDEICEDNWIIKKAIEELDYENVTAPSNCGTLIDSLRRAFRT